jgi:periplasmic copper chaperone A
MPRVNAALIDFRQSFIACCRATLAIILGAHPMKRVAAAAFVLLLGLPAYAADIEFSGAFLRAPPTASGAAAGFVTIINHGAAPDRLVAAQSPIAGTVELHTHIKDGDVFRMRQVDTIPVPAHGSAELKPGGDHIMFMGLTDVPKPGTQVPVTLTFEKAGKLVVEMPVVAPGAMGTMPMPMQHGH